MNDISLDSFKAKLRQAIHEDPERQAQYERDTAMLQAGWSDGGQFAAALPEIGRRIQCFRESLAAVGFQPPDGIDAIIHLGRVCELSWETIAGMTAGDIQAEALAWMERERLRAQIRGELAPPKVEKPAPPPRKKRRRSGAARPITDRQRQAMESYARHQGKITDIARDLGVSRAAAAKLLRLAWLKLHDLAPTPTKPVGRTRRLPTDRRGQVSI